VPARKLLRFIACAVLAVTPLILSPERAGAEQECIEVRVGTEPEVGVVVCP
jgi:hypothetical protein